MKLKTGIVGATGIVGQQFIIALQGHPWFEISRLAASQRSAGKKYIDALRDDKTGSIRWFCNEKPNDELLDFIVDNANDIDCKDLDVVFSAVDSESAQNLEPKIAKTTPVISTASAFRYEEDVPILIPGINSNHAKIINKQRKNRGWQGFITTQPNCTTTGMVITLKPIAEKFGLNKVIMTSLQSLSGAGRSPGVSGLDILDNVIPYIVKEEEKVQIETLKILGEYDDDKIIPTKIKISCTCTRVNVLEGHTEVVFLSTIKRCSLDDVRETLTVFGKELEILNLPSAPKKMIIVTDDPFRPQPRLDRENCSGMATTVGRIRRDIALENGIKYVLVSHNTKMGAAKGAVLVAENLFKEGYI